MKWQDIDRQECSVARALSEIGERWSLLVIREAFMGAKKFGDYLSGTGAARNIVAARLDRLVKAEILKKKPYQQSPTRYEYRLTEKGLELFPIIMHLVKWGDKWHDKGKGCPVEHVHYGCNQVFHTEAVCSECGEKVGPRDVMLRPGPGSCAS